MAVSDEASTSAATADTSHFADSPAAAPAFLINKKAYLSPEIGRLEKERLWPKVWQMVCRLEELPKVGSFITYEIGDESIIVVRVSTDVLRAYHNVCRHRGRRILRDNGQVSNITCRFHGWRWRLDGSIDAVTEREDWAGCEHMEDEDLALRTVHVDHWGGWVFVNPDPNCTQSLADYLGPVVERVSPYQFELQRARWHKTVTVKCNWKVALEAFNEFYHVTATHAQLQRYQDDISRCYVFGDHGMMSYPPELNRLWGSPAARTGLPVPTDYRQAIVDGVNEFERTFKAIWSPRAVAATHRLLTELPPNVSSEIALTKMVQYWKEAAIAEGAGWPEISYEQQAKAGYDWHVFPNFIFLMGLDAAVFYRVRPNGDDTESCIFDIWSMVRYVPGGEPTVEHEIYEKWQDCSTLGLILIQDFTNMEQVQRGMKSSGFTQSRTNPLQESVLVNFHRAVSRFIGVSVIDE